MKRILVRFKNLFSDLDQWDIFIKNEKKNEIKNEKKKIHYSVLLGSLFICWKWGIIWIIESVWSFCIFLCPRIYSVSIVLSTTCTCNSRSLCLMKITRREKSGLLIMYYQPNLNLTKGIASVGFICSRSVCGGGPNRNEIFIADENKAFIWKKKKRQMEDLTEALYIK